jgi:phospholipid transport system substrate-binding protein
VSGNGDKQMKVLKNLWLIGVFLSSFSVLAQAPAMTALETAEKGVQALLQTVVESKPLFISDRDQYFKNVEDVLSRFVDFEEVAVVVMSRYGENATPAQKTRLAEILKVTLTRFYGATLASYNGEQLVFIPAANPPSDPRADHVVGMEMRGAENSAFTIQYQMFLNSNDEWKLKNLSLGGINLGRQYFTQFSASMTQYNDNIDLVLDNWK